MIRLANDRVADSKPNERDHTIALLDFAGFGAHAENSFEQVRKKKKKNQLEKGNILASLLMSFYVVVVV